MMNNNNNSKKAIMMMALAGTVATTNALSLDVGGVDVCGAVGDGITTILSKTTDSTVDAINNAIAGARYLPADELISFIRDHVKDFKVKALDGDDTNVEVELPCKYAGDYVCGLRLSSCESSKVTLSKFDLTQLISAELFNFQFQTPTEMNAPWFVESHNSDSPSCGNGVEGAVCNFHSEASLGVASSAPIRINLGTINAEATCKNMFGRTTTESFISVDNFSCSGKVDASTTVDVCTGVCDPLATNIQDTIKLNSVSLKNTSILPTDLQCSKTGDFMTDAAIDIMLGFVPSLVAPANELLQNSINSLIEVKNVPTCY